jgi:hypothetical protein
MGKSLTAPAFSSTLFPVSRMIKVVDIRRVNFEVCYVISHVDCVVGVCSIEYCAEQEIETFSL